MVLDLRAACGCLAPCGSMVAVCVHRALGGAEHASRHTSTSSAGDLVMPFAVLQAEKVGLTKEISRCETGLEENDRVISGLQVRSRPT